jgi:putative sterol carrier protein
MTDATAQVFEAIAERGHDPVLQKASGTVRFDLRRGKQTERWLIAIDKGNVAVSHANADADCILRTDKALFERIVSGEVNAMAAVLRGAVAIEGDPTLLTIVQRLVPRSPQPGRRQPAAATGRSRR